MKVLLIRHGETVDNVRGVYAGSTNSPLTNHGVLQARRLGSHLGSLTRPVIPTHIYASDLQRAVKTAEEVLAAFSSSSSILEDGKNGQEKEDGMRVEIRKCKEIREQDFGYYEGKPFYARPKPGMGKGGKVTGKDAHRLTNCEEPGFVDVESRESMDRRCDSFVETYLMPILLEMVDDKGVKDDNGVNDMKKQKDVKDGKVRGDAKEESEVERKETVLIVSHGIILGHLWRAILARIPRGNITVSIAAQTALEGRGLEHLGGWSNTAYLEVDIEPVSKENKNEVKDGGEALEAEVGEMREQGEEQGKEDAGMKRLRKDDEDEERPEDATMPPEIDVSFTSPNQLRPPSPPPPSTASPHSPFSSSTTNTSQNSKAIKSLKIRILSINNTTHLTGLKKTKGGIGSARYDEGQKTIESFFKKRKTK